MKKGLFVSLLLFFSFYMAAQGRFTPNEQQTPLILYNAFPNPFDQYTNITFHLPATTYVRLCIYDILSRKVIVLAEGMMDGGNHAVRFYANNVPDGVYCYILTTDNEVVCKTMQVIRKASGHKP